METTTGLVVQRLYAWPVSHSFVPDDRDITLHRVQERRRPSEDRGERRLLCMTGSADRDVFLSRYREEQRKHSRRVRST